MAQDILDPETAATVKVVNDACGNGQLSVEVRNACAAYVEETLRDLLGLDVEAPADDAEDTGADTLAP